MARGKRATSTDALTEHDLDDLNRVWKKLGGNDKKLLKLLKSIVERQAPKLGAPRKDFFKDISVSELPWKGLYLVRFKIGGAAPLVNFIVRPQKHRLKRGDPLKTWVELQCEEKYGKNWQFSTPHQVFRQIVEAAWKACEEISQDKDLSPAQREQWDPRRRLGLDVENVVRKLACEFRQRAKRASDPRAQAGVEKAPNI